MNLQIFPVYRQYHPGNFWLSWIFPEDDGPWKGQLLSNMASLWYLLIKFRGYALADPSGFRGMLPSFHNIWLKPLYDMIHDDPSWLSAMILCYPWSRMIHHHHHPLNSRELIVGPCQLVVAITPFTPEEKIVIWPTFFFCGSRVIETKLSKEFKFENCHSCTVNGFRNLANSSLIIWQLLGNIGFINII